MCIDHTYWLLGACGFVMAAAATEPPNSESAPPPAATVTFHLDDMQILKGEVEKTVSLKRNGTVRVRLPWQAAGYRWVIYKPALTGLKQEGEAAPQVEVDADKPGAPEFRVFTFVAEKKGEVEFRRVYATKNHDKVARVKVRITD
jgi:Chagasin family peptidase inhibitor I42